MPIPPRFRLQVPKPALIKQMCGLCTEIERAIETGDDASDLLTKWHHHATRIYDPTEFTTYWKAIDLKEFVREALNPRPKMVEDLTYSEAAAVLECLSEAELSSNESSYFLEWLETQFPNTNVCNLVYWPDQWFDDASLIRNANGSFKPEAELSTEQLLGYAMAKSHRMLPGAPPDIELPFPMPQW